MLGGSLFIWMGFLFKKDSKTCLVLLKSFFFFPFSFFFFLLFSFSFSFSFSFFFSSYFSFLFFFFFYFSFFFFFIFFCFFFYFFFFFFFIIYDRTKRWRASPSLSSHWSLHFGRCARHWQQLATWLCKCGPRAGSGGRLHTTGWLSGRRPPPASLRHVRTAAWNAFWKHKLKWKASPTAFQMLQ